MLVYPIMFACVSSNSLVVNNSWGVKSELRAGKCSQLKYEFLSSRFRQWKLGKLMCDTF